MKFLLKQIRNMLVIALIVTGVSFIIYKVENIDREIIMGGKYNIEKYNKDEDNIEKEVDATSDIYNIEKYFRPSKLPILNNREIKFDNIYDKKPSEIKLPKELFKTPEDTILNYYSILREAANPLENKKTGCGTIGEATIPYPIAYNYLDKSYQEQLSYKKYLKSFENILHINLIKVEQIPTIEDDLKYFVEIETIEGSDTGVGYFAYYYGYIYLKEDNGKYKISKIDYYGENYLCAPYHGWRFDADMYVDIKYGDWCNLIKEKHPTEQDGYKKKVKFLGTDGKEYMILFYELTNGTDIEIAQYIKNNQGEWIQIKLEPEKCLDKKTPNNN